MFNRGLNRSLTLPNDCFWIKAKLNECALKLWPKCLHKCKYNKYCKHYIKPNKSQSTTRLAAINLDGLENHNDLSRSWSEIMRWLKSLSGRSSHQEFIEGIVVVFRRKSFRNLWRGLNLRWSLRGPRIWFLFQWCIILQKNRWVEFSLSKTFYVSAS